MVASLLGLGLLEQPADVAVRVEADVARRPTGAEASSRQARSNNSRMSWTYIRIVGGRMQIAHLQEILQVQDFGLVQRRPPNRRSSEER